MRNGSRYRVALTAALALPLLASAGPPPSTVSVTVTGLRSTKGMIRACLTPDPQRFPDCRGAADALSLSVPAATHVELTFRGVPAGSYAIALLHDENANGRADKALGLIPTEGFGFSRDAPVRMGPPRFGQAEFPVDGRDVSQTIRMRYLM